MSRKYLALCTIVYAHVGTGARITALPKTVVEGIRPDIAAELVNSMQLRPLSRGELVDMGIADDYDHDAGASFAQRQPVTAAPTPTPVPAVEEPVVQETEEPEDEQESEAGDAAGDAEETTEDAANAEGEAAKTETAEGEKAPARRRRSATAGV